MLLDGLVATFLVLECISGDFLPELRGMPAASPAGAIYVGEVLGRDSRWCVCSLSGPVLDFLKAL